MTRTQPVHLSFSALNGSAQCRRGWFSRYILGRKTPPGEAAAFGKRFEDALSADLRAVVCPATHRPQKDEPRPTPEIPNPSAQQVIEMSKAVDAAEERLQDEIRRGLSIYRDHAETLQPNIIEGRVLLAQKEVWLEPGQWEVLADFYGVRSSIHLPLLGYIDFLEQTGPSGLVKRIVDLKTSTRKGWQLSWGIQTTLYALAERAQTCEDHLVVRPTVRLDADGNPIVSKRPAQFRSFVYRFNPTPATFAWAMQWAGTWAEQIRKDSEADCIESLPATPNFGCQWCPENGLCEPYLLSKLTALGDAEAEE